MFFLNRQIYKILLKFKLSKLCVPVSLLLKQFKLFREIEKL